MSTINSAIINNKASLTIAKKLIALFAASLVAASACADNKADQPKLVVGIVVDDLQNEYISLLRDQFGVDGFKRLLDNGVIIPNADYGTALDPAAATALLYTGAAPSVNGIPAAEVFDRETQRPISIFTDQESSGNFTSQKYSPNALCVTTISDEVRVAGAGVTYAYGIAPDAPRAMTMAGHAGNCGMWLNDANESWATSNFYKDAPSTLNQRNRINSLRIRIDTIAWSPIYGKEKYSILPSQITTIPFKHTFRQYSAPQKMQAFKNTPKVNDEVTAFAIDNINSLNLGSHGGPDMISVAYSVAPYELSKSTDTRYELIDAYYRLDKNLAQLFQAIDSKVGLNNTLIFLAATPPSQRTRRDDERWNLPYGEFSTMKAVSLLNLYLIAIYGNGDWVQSYHNGQFFLNHKLIEQRDKDLRQIRIDCARFLERMSGVTKAYSVDEIIDSRSVDTYAIKRNMLQEYAGDVFVTVMPGWQIVDDLNNVQVRTEKVERSVAATAPVFIMGPGIEPQTITETVDARAIAPTVTRILRIRSPNAASVAPLNLK